MSPLVFSVASALVRGGCFSFMATLGAGPLLPSSARLGLATLLSLLAGCAAVPEAATSAVGNFASLGSQALVAGLVGFAFSLPFRALLSGAGEVGERLARGGAEIPRVAVFLGCSSWVAGGGLESLLRVFLSLDSLPAGELGSLVTNPSLVAQIGSVVFAAVATAMLPSLAFVVGLRLFLALATLHSHRRPAWISAVVALTGVLFLAGSLSPLSRASVQALDLGGRLLLGGV